MELFASSKIHCAFGRIARKATGDDYTHGGIKVSPVKTFEQRIRCGFYPWVEYLDPDFRWISVGINASPTAIKRSYDEVFRDHYGKAYGVGQLLSIAGVLALSRVGIDKKQSITKRLVCSELVWRMMAGIGGEIEHGLRQQFRNPDNFRPEHQVWFWEKNPEWFPRTGWQGAE